MDAKKSGTFLDMDDFKFLLNEFQSNRVFQVALGGGEPTLHPDFITILKKLHKRNITPNYTTNGSKLTKEIVNATKNFCGAVGVSHSNSRKEEVMDAVTQYLAVGVEAHLHVIVSHSTISTLPNIIQDYINIGIRMFDLLLFKPKGRAASLKKEIITVDDIPVYYEIFKEIHSRYGRSIRMSFDACFTPINIGLPVKPETIEGCPGSRHTIHIDHQLLAKPCSFLSNNYCFSLQEKSIKDAWNSPQFQSFRKHLFNSDKGACSECKYHGVCWGKCPEIEELHLCYKEINERN